MTPLHRFEESSLSSVRHAEARGFLTDVGLPRDHLLFSALPTPVPRTGVGADGSARSLLAVGRGADDDTFCVDPHSGAFVYLSGHDGSVWHVNASPSAFLECLREFDAGFPYGDADSEGDEHEESAARLTEALGAVDPSAFREDPGFWYSLMHDVAIGDYAAD